MVLIEIRIYNQKMIGMCRIERIDWGPRLDWFDLTFEQYLQRLKEQIGEDDWSYLIGELNHYRIKFPEPDGVRYFESDEGLIAPKFAWDLYWPFSRKTGERIPVFQWGLNRLLNDRNSEEKHLTHHDHVDQVMSITQENSGLGFEEAQRCYFDIAKDSNGDPVTEERLIEIGLVLFKKLVDSMPVTPKSCIDNIGMCIAYVHKVTISSSYDAWKMGEAKVLQFLRENFEGYTIESTPPEVDIRLRADIWIIISDDFRIGVQVKSHTYPGSVSSTGFRERYRGRILMAKYRGNKVIDTEQLTEGVQTEINRLQELIDSSES